MTVKVTVTAMQTSFPLLEDMTLIEQRQLIVDTLKILHKTAVSKKNVADRLRAAIGLLPGEPVH